MLYVYVCIYIHTYIHNERGGEGEGESREKGQLGEAYKQKVYRKKGVTKANSGKGIRIILINTVQFVDKWRKLVSWSPTGMIIICLHLVRKKIPECT